MFQAMTKKAHAALIGICVNLQGSNNFPSLINRFYDVFFFFSSASLEFEYLHRRIHGNGISTIIKPELNF